MRQQELGRQPEVTQMVRKDPGPHMLTDSECAKLVPLPFRPSLATRIRHLRNPETGS